QKALEKAYTAQGTSGEGIDAKFAASDELLSQICDHYDTRKWFSISQDLGGGALIKMPF
ncbi:MAG: hypothetical protein QOJ65_1066, partial [Fimbriimonadaceae bacterium]|nr:hypothetical protein [Fimbriimonadaceae bacterium]